MQVLNSDNLVNRVLALWDAGIKDDETIIENIHSEFQISLEEAELALELTKTGLFCCEPSLTSQPCELRGLGVH